MIHIPVSTYRLQFNKDFKFTDAKNLVAYLSTMGISDIYASPILKAKKGSMHGYDCVDPNQINPELGSDAEYQQLCEEYKKYNMGWLQDIVPNHMAYSSENQMLVDVLENGANSRYYNFFDIEWNYPLARIKNRLLAPFLGKYYQEVLEAGEINLNYNQEGFNVKYYDTCLPLKIETYINVISFRLDKLRNKLGRNNSDFIKYQGLLYVIKSLPSSQELEERYYQIKFIKGLLWQLYSENTDIKVFINENIKDFNGNAGSKDSFDLLDKLISAQNFRLSFWKVANEEINYRRFFNINELISLKMENDETFIRTHSFILRLIKDDLINGLRIDHVDGLYDPKKYLKTLRERSKNTYIVVEKILELDEEIPDDWQIEGTTGYDYLNYLNGVFCFTKNGKKFTSIYHSFIKREINFEELVKNNKRLFIKTRIAGELDRLAFYIEEISSKDRHGIDITLNGLKNALEEILIQFPIYRTYITEDNFYERDKNYLTDVLQKVKEENPLIVKELDYIGNLLLQNFNERFNDEQKNKIYDFIMKFQQLTGPLMAKGFEDTTLYQYNRFISLNEVGSNPEKFGFTIKEFHNFNKQRQKKFPHSLNASSTHDTKRGEDASARLNVLSEMPDLWNEKIKLWQKTNFKFKQNINGEKTPNLNAEYFLYQNLIGSFPFNQTKDGNYIKRLKDYLIKASREAKEHTSWIQPNENYENAFTAFAEKILQSSNENIFLNDFLTFQKKIAYYGVFNSLSQTLLKITSPGVPDFYQGSELWDFSFVDPDNRRPVNYELRKKYLSEIRKLKLDELNNYFSKLFSEKENGKIKMFLIYRSLKARNENKDLFDEGEYIPLETGGEFKQCIIAFARKHKNNIALITAVRFLTKVISENQNPIGADIWKDTYLKLPFENIEMTDAITSRKIQVKGEQLVSDILKDFPVSILSGAESV